MKLVLPSLTHIIAALALSQSVDAIFAKPPPGGYTDLNQPAPVKPANIARTGNRSKDNYMRAVMAAGLENNRQMVDKTINDAKRQYSKARDLNAFLEDLRNQGDAYLVYGSARSTTKKEDIAALAVQAACDQDAELAQQAIGIAARWWGDAAADHILKNSRFAWGISREIDMANKGRRNKQNTKGPKTPLSKEDCGMMIQFFVYTTFV